jgi:hypothetical protein
MARGHTRTRSEVQGISVRSLADEPRIARVGEHFASQPDGSLRELYDAGDKVRLFDKGQYAYLQVREVKERSIIASSPNSAKPIRLVLEKDLQGRVVGLKESGAKGRRVD